MKRLILPILLTVAGVAGGGFAGTKLRPEPLPPEAEAEVPAVPETPPEYVRLTNQFIVPVLKEGRVTSMVVLSLGLEVEIGATDLVFAHEPKLRDVFLQVLFGHANNGGFDRDFTDAANILILRTALEEAASRVLPDQVRAVLINDITRQDG